MIKRPRKWLGTTALLILPILAGAQSTALLPPETQLIATSGAPAPTQETFTIATAQDLVATFTDLQTPAALSAASIVVTQGASVVGMSALASPATSATVSLPAAVGQYTLYVTGTPNSTFNVGTFTVCVAPKSTPSACIQSASLAGNITLQSAPTDPTVSTATATLTVATGGVYTFTYTDDQFPAALNVAPSLALFQGSTQVSVPVPASPAAITLNPGVYSLFAIAQADQTTKAGLYSISVTGPGGASLLDSVYAVGILGQPFTATNPGAQTVALKVTDFAFPAALAGATAVVTSGSRVLATATVGTGTSFGASAGPLSVYSFATAGTASSGNASAGTYEIDLSAPSGSLLQSAAAVNGGGNIAYALLTPAVTVSALTATASDLDFPSALQGLAFAVAQNGVVLQAATEAGSVSFTPAAGPLVLLVAATPPTNGNGLFDINVQTTATTPSFLFDRTQGVGTSDVFYSQSLTAGTSGNYAVTLTDLMYPAAFNNLAVVVSNGGQVLGKILGGGSFPVTTAPGTYLLTFIATPGASQNYGLYGIQVAPAAPTVTLAASPQTVNAGSSTTLSWTSTNATSCTASGGVFTGSESASGTGSASVVVSATTTYTLTCTGPGGAGMQSVQVTATEAVSHNSGGGALDLRVLSFLGLLSFLKTVPARIGRRR